MSSIQKVLLAGSCIFFAATIYSFFVLELYLIILFLLLHSLCLIFFAYKTYSDASHEEVSIATYHQDVGMEIAQKDNEINDLTERMIEKETMLLDVQRENQELKSSKEELQKNIEQLEKDNKGYEERIKNELDSALAGVVGLLPPVDEEAGERQTVNIIAIAEEARDELFEDAKAANLHITVSSQGDTLLVRADRNRLLTLFRNIIDNSIKYMKRAGSLVITISTIGDDIFIVLKDTGEGLPEEETKHIFELNFQGSNRISGNGLGLAQARAIVESYGGTIYAKSTEGSGMGIYIQLPA
ncbi:MAG: HAMP domain-containing histidine kinase [Lachnospiraceae bacterium]|nr:HAMP domain-containing histidine kinase [Lachnospiraceae bacterium]